MYWPRVAGVFGASLLFFMLASAPFVYAKDRAADAMCLPPDDTHGYKKGLEYDALYKDGDKEKRNLYNKKCFDDFVTGICDREDYCEGKQCFSDGKWGNCELYHQKTTNGQIQNCYVGVLDCSKPYTPGQGTGVAPPPSENPSLPPLTHDGKSILQTLQDNEQPSGPLPQSANNVQQLIEQAAQNPDTPWSLEGIKNVLNDVRSFLSPESATFLTPTPQESGAVNEQSQRTDEITGLPVTDTFGQPQTQTEQKTSFLDTLGEAWKEVKSAVSDAGTWIADLVTPNPEETPTNPANGFAENNAALTDPDVKSDVPPTIPPDQIASREPSVSETPKESVDRAQGIASVQPTAKESSPTSPNVGPTASPDIVKKAAQALSDATEAFGAARGYSKEGMENVKGGLGALAQMESRFDPSIGCNEPGYCGFGQLSEGKSSSHENETALARNTLGALSQSPNLSPEQQAQVSQIVDRIDSMQAQGKSPNADPETGAWLLAARQAQMTDIGKNVSPMDAAAKYAQTPTDAAGIMFGAQLAPSMYGKGFNPDAPLSSGAINAFNSNKVSVQSGSTMSDAIAAMQEQPIYRQRFAEGIGIIGGGTYSSPDPLISAKPPGSYFDTALQNGGLYQEPTFQQSVYDMYGESTDNQNVAEAGFQNYNTEQADTVLKFAAGWEGTFAGSAQENANIAAQQAFNTIAHPEDWPQLPAPTYDLDAANAAEAVRLAESGAFDSGVSLTQEQVQAAYDAANNEANKPESWFKSKVVNPLYDNVIDPLRNSLGLNSPQPNPVVLPDSRSLSDRVIESIPSPLKPSPTIAVQTESLPPPMDYPASQLTGTYYGPNGEIIKADVAGVEITQPRGEISAFIPSDKLGNMTVGDVIAQAKERPRTETAQEMEPYGPPVPNRTTPTPVELEAATKILDDKLSSARTAVEVAKAVAEAAPTDFTKDSVRLLEQRLAQIEEYGRQYREYMVAGGLPPEWLSNAVDTARKGEGYISQGLSAFSDAAHGNAAMAEANLRTVWDETKNESNLSLSQMARLTGNSLWWAAESAAGLVGGGLKTGSELAGLSNPNLDNALKQQLDPEGEGIKAAAIIAPFAYSGLRHGGEAVLDRVFGEVVTSEVSAGARTSAVEAVGVRDSAGFVQRTAPVEDLSIARATPEVPRVAETPPPLSLADSAGSSLPKAANVDPVGDVFAPPTKNLDDAFAKVERAADEFKSPGSAEPSAPPASDNPFLKGTDNITRRAAGEAEVSSPAASGIKDAAAEIDRIAAEARAAAKAPIPEVKPAAEVPAPSGPPNPGEYVPTIKDKFASMWDGLKTTATDWRDRLFGREITEPVKAPALSQDELALQRMTNEGGPVPPERTPSTPAPGLGSQGEASWEGGFAQRPGAPTVDSANWTGGKDFKGFDLTTPDSNAPLLKQSLEGDFMYPQAPKPLAETTIAPAPPVETKTLWQSTKELFGLGEKPSTPAPLAQAERDALAAGDQARVVERTPRPEASAKPLTDDELALIRQVEVGTVPNPRTAALTPDAANVPVVADRPVPVSEPSLWERWFGKSEPAAIETPKVAVVPETTPTPKALDATAPRAEPSPAEATPPARPAAEPAPIEPVKRGSGDVSKPNAEIAMGDEGAVPLKPGAENPSGKVWNDKSLTRDEFIADYKAVYPKTSLTDAQLAERYAVGQRLNPETGRLKVPETQVAPGIAPAAPTPGGAKTGGGSSAGLDALKSTASFCTGGLFRFGVCVGVGGGIYYGVSNLWNGLWPSSQTPPPNVETPPKDDQSTAVPDKDKDAPPPRREVSPPYQPPVVRRDVVPIGSVYAPPIWNPNGGPILSQDYYCITSIQPVIVIPLSAGSQFPSNCYNSYSGGQGGSGNPFSMLGQMLARALGIQPTPLQPPMPQTPPPTNPPPIIIPPRATSTPQKPIVTLIANPATVAPQGKARLSWSSTGASVCGVFMPDGAKIGEGNPDGSTSTPPLAATTVFTAKCSATSGATSSAQTTVTVR
ncbi:MAG: hypothetical protein Q7S50_01430 [bacterium]|nr:hypothetical protein [bacterium]